MKASTFKDFDDFAEFIDNYAMDKDIDDAISGIKGEVDNVRFVDEKIDDGLDNGAYLMMRSYDIFLGDYKAYARFYYGNDDYVVTCVMVDED